MVLIDVNVLVYAHRADAPGHSAMKRWIEGALKSPQAFGLSEWVLSGFLRIVTHPRVFDPPSPMKAALAFANELRDQPNCVVLAPGPRHWEIFTQLCRATGVKGNLVPDAYLAALAIETGSVLVTTDRDFARFPDLLWRHPLA